MGISCLFIFFPLFVFGAFRDDVVENTKAAVVALYLDENLTVFRASGFFIDSSGTVITAKHAVKNNGRLWAWLYNGKKLELILDRFQENNDLAIMLPIIPKNKKMVFSYLKLGNTQNLVIGQPIAVIGNSLGGLWQVLYGNIVNFHIRIPVEDSDLIFTTIEYNILIQRGFSGSPLIDESGNVLGINIATTKALSNDNASYAISSTEMKLFIKEFYQKLPK